jgi:hypothetical protein
LIGIVDGLLELWIFGMDFMKEFFSLLSQKWPMPNAFTPQNRSCMAWPHLFHFGNGFAFLDKKASLAMWTL